MFRIAVSPTYLVPVSVPVLTEAGKKDTLTFKARFKRLTNHEIKTLGEELLAGKIDDPGVIDRYMVGFDDVADESGNALEYSNAARDKLMAIYPTEQRTVKAFLDSITEARGKN